MSVLEESGVVWRVQRIGMGRVRANLPGMVKCPLISLKINPELIAFDSAKGYEMEVSSVLLCFCIVSA